MEGLHEEIDAVDGNGWSDSCGRGHLLNVPWEMAPCTCVVVVRDRYHSFDNSTNLYRPASYRRDREKMTVPITTQMSVILDMVSIEGETYKKEITNVVHFNEGRKIIQVTRADDPSNRASPYNVYGFDLSTVLAYDIRCTPDTVQESLEENEWWGVENSSIPMYNDPPLNIDPMDKLIQDEEEGYGEEN